MIRSKVGRWGYSKVLLRVRFNVVGHYIFHFSYCKFFLGNSNGQGGKALTEAVCHFEFEYSLSSFSL